MRRVRLTQAGWRRLTVVLVTLWLTFITGWSYTAQNASRAQRRRDNTATIVRDRHSSCMQDQKLYDGQIKTVRFIGQKLGATEAQIETGLADLRVVLGTRPSC